MIDFIAYGILSYYPHMAEADAIIWKRFISAYPNAFERVAYDVAVGAGAEFDTTVNPATGGNVGRLYQRRIDVVAQKDGNTYLIELKPRASTAAIGQVVGYKKLFDRDFAELAPVKMLIITDSLLPEMEFLAKDAGVEMSVI